jgi:hypothetical protein
MEYTIRDRGRELGSFTMDQIETKLDDHQIGMMAEVYDGDRWITIAELIENLEQERNQSAKRLTLQQEATAKRNEEEQQKRLLELEIQKERTRQMEVEQKRESPLLEQKSKFSETGLVHNINGAGFAGYICVALSFLLACIFWISIIYGFPLIISIAFWIGVATGSAGLILGGTNCFLGEASRSHGIFQTLGSVITLLLLVIPFVFLEILIAKFT